jgi:Carboxypeptidase regulatory-like domain
MIRPFFVTLVAALFLAAPVRAVADPVQPVDQKKRDEQRVAAKGRPGQAGAQTDTVRLTVAGTIRLPDGSPVAQATVAVSTKSDEPSSSTQTDSAGRFVLRGVFGNNAYLHASSADGRHQTTLIVPSGNTRATFASPIELTLLPAVPHEVVVLSDGHPVEGAHVVAQGTSFQIHGITDNDGRTKIHLPANERFRDVSAWHPRLGVAGAQRRDTLPPRQQTTLSLLAPAPFTLRVVDQDGRGVAGLVLGAIVRTEDSDWIFANRIAAAHFPTDAQGEARLPWVPRDKLLSVNVDIVNSHWQVDQIDLRTIAERLLTVYVRREKIERGVEGRLIMPDGESPEGILISGIGTGNGFATPYVRARRDGTFMLYVAANQGHLLRVFDSQWASDIWSGMILESSTANPAKIEIVVYPATPVLVKVTRGPDRVPVTGAFVEVTSRAAVEWIDGSGTKVESEAAIHGWILTDADGTAHVGVGRGSQKFRLSSGTWRDEQTIDVTSNERVAVDFHRKWVGDRRITGRLMLDGAPYQPSPKLLARAWTPPSSSRHPITVRPDGTFEVAFDEEEASLLIVDRDRQRSGFARVGVDDSTVDMRLQPTATYGGMLVDNSNQPLADRTLWLSLADTRDEIAAPQQTDREGRFRFTGVPANIPLQIMLGHAGDKHQNQIVDRDRLFEPAEIRDDDKIRPGRESNSGIPIEPPIAFAERIARLCRDARLNGLHSLIVLQGDDSRNVIKVAGKVLNDDEDFGDILAYLPMRVEAEKLAAEGQKVDEFGWPKPSAGEIVLVALGGNQETIATLRINVEDAAAPLKLAAGFLSQHRPPRRDAAVLLTEAKKDAMAGNRRVWIVASGPRCGPCRRLARWLDDHRAALMQDYVIVKVMEGIDAHAAEEIARLRGKEEHGIPWYAIIEPDGTILATSDGPLGNIGIPASDEGLRTLRAMLDRTAQRLSTEDKDTLIKSLTPER